MELDSPCLGNRLKINKFKPIFLSLFLVCLWFLVVGCGPRNVTEEKTFKKEEEQALKISILGDSISTYTGYIPEDYSQFYPENSDFTQVEDTWWMQLINEMDMELCANASYSGGTVSGDSKETEDPRAAISDKRIADLVGSNGSAPDVIVVLTGTNELLNNVPLGEYEGDLPILEGNIETFGEAYGLLLQKLQKTYPNAKIYSCTFVEVSRWSDQGENYPFTNKLGLTAADYNERIKTIATALDLPIIDVFDCGITYENAKELTLDGTHPNREGAKRIAKKVIEVFR